MSFCWRLKGAALLALGLLLHSGTAQAQGVALTCITPDYTLYNNHSGPLDPTHQISDPWGFTKLNAVGQGNQALIMQQETNNPMACRTIQSFRTDNNALFVPWQTATEWTSFVTALKNPNVGAKATGACCPPQTFQICGNAVDVNGNHLPQYTSLPAVPLGWKVLGTPYAVDQATGLVTNAVDPTTQKTIPIFPLSDGNGNPLPMTLTTVGTVPLPTAVLNWGAEGDHYGPVCAATVVGDPTINYETEWICIGGSWKQMSEIGSCIPIDGDCSISPGQALAALPVNTQTLCIPHTVIQNLQTTTNAAGVTTGWTWQCAGTPGRVTKSCSAIYSASVNGICGGDNGAAITSLLPNDPDLCASGTVSAFTGNGPFTWQCLGIGTGATVSCSTSGGSAVDPACGVADTGGASYTLAQLQGFVTTAPSNLCAPGTFNTNYGFRGGGTSPYFWWYCSGTINAQNVVGCSANNSVIDGNCGDNNGATYNSLTNGPGSSLCDNNGSTASIPVYNPTTKTWAWSCAGVNGGATATCSAIYNPAAIVGVCGTANNGSYCALSPTDPTLCQTGTPTPIIINGRWYGWTCTGAGGGTSMDCQALNTCAPGACGNAAGNPSSSAPQGGLCQVGTPSNVTQVGSNWTWTCSGGGTPAVVASCTAPVSLSTQVAACGPATSAPSSTSPSPSSLCSPGNASTPQLDSTNTLWQWSCSITGGNTVACSTTASSGTGGGCTGASCGGTGGVVNGACGTAQGATSISAPTVGLCGAGSVGILPGPDINNQNWTWSCVGSGTGATTATCTAPMALANGQCGSAVGIPVSAPPTNFLCNSGQPSAVTTTTPFSWTCLGIGGGTNSGLCQSAMCTACGGSGSVLQSVTYTGTGLNRCLLTLQASWTENDTYGTSGTSIYSMSWIDDTGSHAYTEGIGTANYCQPCYGTLSSISGLKVIVTSVSAGCTSYTVGQTLTPTSVGAKQGAKSTTVPIL